MICQEAVMKKRKNVLLKAAVLILGIYNTEEEVDYLLEVLPEAVENAKKLNAENFNMAEPLY